MTHVSIRLPWHDRGWDGHVCDHPERNSYCGGLRSVNADRIRSRDIERESSNRSIAVNGDFKPPCTETINVFGQSSIEHLHIPPAFITGASPTKEIYEPGSSGTWPFENMWLDNGDFRPAADRRKEADQHFSALKPGRSLAFYYCNYDNPLSGDNNRYLLRPVYSQRIARKAATRLRSPAKQASVFS
jgi:exodeoxyribonuclease V alpha subunit